MIRKYRRTVFRYGRYISENYSHGTQTFHNKYLYLLIEKWDVSKIVKQEFILVNENIEYENIINFPV